MTAQQPRSRGRRRALRWGRRILVAGLTVTLAWYAVRAAAGSTSPPVATRRAAEAALADLQRAGTRWAPAVSRSAEEALRAAQLEYRRQEAAFFLVRDFDAARAALRRAEAQLEEATRLALARRDEARAEAGRAIDEAGTTIARTDRFARAIALSKYEHMLLRKSRMAVHEAGLLLAAGEYDAAEERAELASLQAARVAGRAADAAARFTDPQHLRQWRSMIAETVGWSRQTGGAAIVVVKEGHKMTLYDGGRAVRTYRVELGSNSVRDKLHAGDNATPEGRYRVTSKKGRGASRYHMALLLDYPNAEDRAHFNRMRKAGEVPRGVSPGGLIEIHGHGGRGKDWTNGCVAITNAEMEDLFRRVQVGTPVTIVGSDGSAGAFTAVLRAANAEAAARARDEASGRAR